MSTPTIDYDALAKQAGAISPGVDYASLAKQAGAISSTGKRPLNESEQQDAAVPGLLAGGGAQAPGESMFHAGTRQLIGGVGRALKGIVSMPLELAKPADLTDPAEAALAKDPGQLAAYRLLKPHLDLASRSADEFKQGKVKEGIGSALFAATPVVGPAVSGAVDRAKAGDIGGVSELATMAAVPEVAGKAIETVPVVAKTAAKNVARKLAPVADSAAEALRSSAENHIEQVLGATTKKLKSIASDKVVPGILDRGLTANTREGLSQQASEGVAKHGADVAQGIQAATESGQTVPVQPIIERLEGLKSHPDYTLTSKATGEVTAQRQAPIDQIDEVQGILRKYGDAITPEDLVGVRRFIDDAVAKKKMAFLADDTKGYEAHAQEGAANVLRDTINSQFPEVAAANKEYSFYKNLQNVIDATIQRKASQSGIVSEGVKMARGGGAGAIVGGAVAGPTGVVVGGTLGRLAEAVHDSTAYRTRMAGLQTDIAGWLDKSRTGSADPLDSFASTAAQKAQDQTNAQPQTVPAPTPVQAPGPTPQGEVVPAAPEGPGVVDNQAQPGAQSTNGNSSQPTPDAETAPVRQSLQGENRPQGAAGRGAATEISVPGEATKYPATYRIRELADINPSHSGLSFQPNENYGGLKNDRNYSNAINQGKIVQWSKGGPGGFQPDYHLTDNPSAENGPPVVDEAGNVLGGNGRTMILQRVSKYNRGGMDAYKAMLAKKAAQFGIDPADVAGMKQPVLIREIPESHFQDLASGKANAITDFNKKGTAALTPSETAIADSRRVSQGTLDHMAGVLEAAGPDATLADVLQKGTGIEVLNRLTHDGVISPQERAGLATKDALTDAGKKRISQLMVGRYFQDAAQIDTINAAIRNKLERVAAPLAKVENIGGEWDITPKVREAISLLEEMKAAGAKSVGDLVKQRGLFRETEQDPDVSILAEALKSLPQGELVKAVRRYAGDANYGSKPGLFGAGPTPEQAFRDAFRPSER